MTIEQVLTYSRQKLKTASIETYILDAEVLLAHVIGKDRAWLLAHLDDSLDSLQGRTSQQQMEVLLKRRVRHEPIAYIIGSCEFYGRRFEVNEHTLVPRPESETMIELLLNYFSNIKYQISNISLVDVGTGSGALGITAALELQAVGCRLSAIGCIDIDKNCIQVAKRNAKLHGVEAESYTGNLLQPWLQHRVKKDRINSSLSTVILANLPYVPDDYPINEAARHEPKHAIFAGTDGLDLYREMFTQLATQHSTLNTLLVLTESLPFQHKELTQIAKRAGFHQLEQQDFIQVFDKTS